MISLIALDKVLYLEGGLYINMDLFLCHLLFVAGYFMKMITVLSEHMELFNPYLKICVCMCVHVCESQSTTLNSILRYAVHLSDNVAHWAKAHQLGQTG